MNFTPKPTGAPVEIGHVPASFLDHEGLFKRDDSRQ
jgi:hypothetical protein